MQFLDGDAALAASSRDGIGRPRVDRPGEWWQTVFVDDLAIHSVHLNPYSAARRVAQLQILAERLPTGYNVVLGDFNLAPRLGVGQTVAARQDRGRPRGAEWKAAPKRMARPPARTFGTCSSSLERTRGVALGVRFPQRLERRCTRNRDAQTC